MSIIALALVLVCACTWVGVCVCACACVSLCACVCVCVCFSMLFDLNRIFPTLELAEIYGSGQKAGKLGFPVLCVPVCVSVHATQCVQKAG